MDGEEDVFHLTRRSFELHGRRHHLTMLRRLTRELARQEVATWKKVTPRDQPRTQQCAGADRVDGAVPGRAYAERGDKVSLKRSSPPSTERARHLEQFIGGYARFAKLPNPRLMPVPWEVLLDSVVQSHPVQLLRPLPETPVNVDRAQIEQVLINLVKNAIEAGSAPNEVEIQVSDVGPQFLLQVRDRGSGMGADTVLEQALLPFYSTKRAGTGLGTGAGARNRRGPRRPHSPGEPARWRAGGEHLVAQTDRGRRRTASCGSDACVARERAPTILPLTIGVL